MRKTNGERTRKTGTDEELTELEVLLTDLLFKISVKRKFYIVKTNYNHSFIFRINIHHNALFHYP